MDRFCYSQWFLFILVANVVVISSRDSIAAEEPYCGLYSMNAALHSLGINAEIEQMVRPEYLRGGYGSSADQLINLATYFGAASAFQTDMNVATLRSLDCPVILHTSTAAGSTTGFHHWVTFLGFEGSLIKVFEPPYGVNKLTEAELLCMWCHWALENQPLMGALFQPG